MRAALYEEIGPAEDVLVVREVEDPSPVRGEVRVRVAFSGVNPVDWKVRMHGPLTTARQIPHHDGAGTIDRVGDGVDPARVGERVWVYHAALSGADGTAAELTCVPADQAVPLPAGTTLEHGAGLGIPAITAHACVFADGPVADRTVLVTGGAGAVGHAAVQLARWGGARVITTASTPEKRELAGAAGADAVLDYTAPTHPEELAEHASLGIDRVVDVALSTNIGSYADLLAPQAVVAAYARDRDPSVIPFRPLMRCNASVRYVLVFGLRADAVVRAVDDVSRCLRDGVLHPLPSRAYRLDAVADAHVAVERGALGKVLLDLR